MEDGKLLILDYISQGRLSVDDAVALIEALSEDPAPEVFVLPLPLEPALVGCLN
jgi:hypothetical protein